MGKPEKPAQDGSKRHDDDYFARQWEGMKKKNADELERRKRASAKGNDRPNTHGESKTPYTPWLLIPVNPGDYGVRPLPSGTPYWGSPFIGVISPDPSGAPLAGAENQVFARVFNLGASTAAPVMVRFYWADPSVGLGTANAHFIGEIMAEIPPLSSHIVTCPTPWVPTFLNDGHECLFASVTHVMDPITAPFAPWADRHFGQRNLSVLPAIAQSFQIWLPPTTAQVLELHVLAVKITVPDGLMLRRTPVETIEHLAAQVMGGFGGGRAVKRGRGSKAINFQVERINAAHVVKGAEFLGETQPARVLPPAEAKDQRQAAHRLGEAVLKIEGRADVAQLCQLAFGEIELAGNEFILLNLTSWAGGMVGGGYIMTFANPRWFDPAKLDSHHDDERRKMMKDQKTPDGKEGRRDLRDLVIANNPEAKATLEIARTLAAELPIQSAKGLRGGLEVGGVKLSGEALTDLFGSALPIADEEELVAKVAAAVRVFVAEGEAHRPMLGAGPARLLDTLKAHGGVAPIQMLFSSGKPIFALSREDKEY